MPVIDGVCPSWADMSVRASPIGGSLLEIGDLLAISTGSTVEIGKQREGGRVIKRTQGSVDNEASWALYASGYMKLLRGLRGIAPLRGNQRQLSLAHFNISIIWTPQGSTEIFEKRLKGCRILTDQEDAAEGNDAAQIEMALDPIQICRVVDGEEYVLL